MGKDGGAPLFFNKSRFTSVEMEKKGRRKTSEKRKESPKEKIEKGREKEEG